MRQPRFLKWTVFPPHPVMRVVGQTNTMNNSFHDETNHIEYIIPAPRQLERHEAELAIQLALESYAEQALAHHLVRHPDTTKEEHVTLKTKFREERVAKQRGGLVLIQSTLTELPEENK